KGQQVQDWLTIQKTTNVFIDTNLENATSLTYYWFSLGPVAIGTSTYHPLSEEEIVLFKRFRNVFDLAYRRYLDIEKAEAQAREAQIQLALERVRARTMAMHKSDELAEVAILLFQQVSDLGIKTWTTGFNIWSDDNNSYEDWITNPQGGFMPPYTIDASKLPVSTKVSNAKKRGDEFLVNYEEGESLAETYRQLGKFGEKQFKSIQESGFEFPSHQYEHFVFGSKVSLMFITYDAVPEAHDIFKRFGKVFEQTYTRFLDLQKAEEQAREARIEAALEKVRSRSLAMHRSDELQEVVHTVFEKLKELNVDFYTVIIVIFQEGLKDIIWWMENKVNQQYPKILVRYADNQYLQDLFEARENGRELLSKCYYGEEKNKLYNHLFQHTDLRHVADTQKKFLLENEFAAMSVAIARNTGIHITNYSKTSFSDEENETLKRFSKVFEQAYIRFMDLQKAEAQAREAQIEAALERVRARAMAMHKSEELNEVANEMRKQLRLLGQEELETCAIHLYDESPDYFQSWAALLSPNEHGEVVQIQSQFPKHGVKIIEEMLECYALRKGDYVLINEGAKAQQFLAMTKQKAPEVFEVVEESMKEQESNDKRAYWSVADFEGGSLVMTTMIEPDENSRVLLRRFANVFGLAYRRFVDIKHAEAQAREAQIEAALERVRSRTLAMQRSDELAETASVLFKQLILLGIEPNRLYINIVKDETGAAEFWITDEDGSQISMAYSENLNANPTFKRMFDGWKAQNRSLIIDMEGRELQEYFKYLSSINVPFKGGLSQKRRLQYIAYFNKGFIGMASPDEQPAETMQLLERFAAVFNLTFTRFNDLKIAEAHALQAEQDLIEIKAAKKKAEDTLIELQATQKQLIQSEKMASLGELTAGIAHEIQNPLNFVNNFSEVSNELIDEMKAELNKGDIDEAKFIADDIKQNLEKINHHGRRADAIVKGMLQHSRTSSGQKEPTDINVLTDEYLRLAYHGLRAKDKSFNADIKTDFDNNIGKINIIPQEIGRVILNLINNAFYAVDEKMKHTSTGSVQNGYEPTVSVSTKKNNEKVEIKVSDNGNGIPSSIIEKIFQPFFTTKPTGQGTGLGLSLAYDIITKGHGGEIKIETKEGEGSKFIIIIPSA
ncbi:MAG: sensor histidine kinase, partial [Flavisolibacter sp.]